MLRKTIVAFVVALMSFCAKAQGVRVSLVTCYPGPVVYELYGHTAIRIVYGGMDRIYNFGMFSFSKPNFIYRFVKGETDYALGAYPTELFLPGYAARGSKVVEQVLDIPPEQAAELFRKLEYLALPENREYRYNYVFDNCATRPRDLIEEAVGGIDYPAPADSTLTFRDIMRSYSENYPWYQFGIDLALGSGVDYALNVRQQLFAPVFLMEAFGKATVRTADGGSVPLVKGTCVLVDGSESPVLPPTPWYLSPMAVAIVLLAAAAVATWRDVRRMRQSRWFDTVWFLLTGILGCLVFFLIFVSEHEATSPNFLGFWLHPLNLLAALAVWIKSWGKWLYWYHFINFAVVLMLLASWWALPQSANMAFFPLMLCSLLRSGGYVVIFRKCGKRNK